MQWLTIRKGLFCALRPQLWPLLRIGVAPAIEHRAALSRLSFRTIVDVGANRGQFAVISRRLFPDSQIYSFEPLQEPAEIFGRALRGDRRVQIFHNAIGETSGTASIYVTTRDDSSSLLKPDTAQQEIFGVQTKRMEEISVQRLSECLTREDLRAPALLKIDVQGGELDVLKGTEELVDCFDAVYVECSYVQLYEGQPLCVDIIRWLGERGFQPAGVYNQYVDQQRGPIQADFLFLKAKLEAMS